MNGTDEQVLLYCTHFCYYVTAVTYLCPSLQMTINGVQGGIGCVCLCACVCVCVCVFVFVCVRVCVCVTVIRVVIHCV